MFDNILNLFKKKGNKDENKNTAKERLHLVLMQDRANVSADFLDLMKQEIIEVIKKYIEVDEDQIDVKLTNKLNGDGTTGAPALYANIPIKSIKKETRINSNRDRDELNDNKKEENTNTTDNTDNTDNTDQNNEVIIETKDNNESEVKNSENSEPVIEENITENIENNSVDNNENNNEESNADNSSNKEEANVEEKDESAENKETTNNIKKQKHGHNNKKKHGNNKTTFFDNIKVNENKIDNKTDEE